MWRRNRQPKAEAESAPVTRPEHACLVDGLVALTEADELMWRPSDDPLDIYSMHRVAVLRQPERPPGVRLDLGVSELVVRREQATERIPCSSETAGLWDAVYAQEERLRRELLTDALIAVDRSSSGEHGSAGATGDTADPAGPTTAAGER